MVQRSIAIFAWLRNFSIAFNQLARQKRTMGFQSFDSSDDQAACAPRTALLRAALKTLRLDGLLIPRTDRHQDEYVPASDERLRWLTGFDGSAGMAVVLTRKAAIFTDGRYVLQVKAQVDGAVYETHNSADTTAFAWLGANLKAGQRLGYDPWLHTVSDAEKLSRACADAGAELIALEANPVDEIWHDRPAPPSTPVVLHPLKYAGTPATEKIAAVRRTIRDDRLDAVVLTLPDSVCWLFNIRGRDLPHTPVVLAFTIVPARGRPQLFVERARLGRPVRAYLSGIARVRPPSAFETALGELGAKSKCVGLDPTRAARAVSARLEATGATVKHRADPCLLPKAIKTAAEIRGTRAAHRRDGAAVTRFLAWLDAEADRGNLSEIDAAIKLEGFRQDTGRLCDLSFDTISGAGPHGAIVHYRVTRKSNRKLKPDTLYLIDSGGQYRDGTTDITRNVAIGTPSGEMRRHFTLVLKGHIALAAALFPAGTSGA